MSPAAKRTAAIGIVVVVVVAITVLSGGGRPADETLAQSFVSAWAHGDWAQMYDDVDPATRARLPVTLFAATYRNALDTATATRELAGHATEAAGGVVTVPVVVRTHLFGSLRSRFVLPITGSPARIKWSESLSFPGLRLGEVLSRQTTLPARAKLLARDGTPLADLPAAAGIIGSLGPIPSELAEQLQQAGYPPQAQVGIDGLERIFEQRLAGKPGGDLYAGGRLIASAPMQAAAPVYTSISPSLQALSVATLGGQEGGIVVMRPVSGEILAVAGTPFSELQPPGSTFKMVTLAGVLLAHLARPTTVFQYATSAVIDGFDLHNANNESCGGTLEQAFAVSCNSVFAPLGARLGARRLLDAAQRLGFNEQPSIPGVAESTVPPDSLQSQLDVASSAIGQGQVQATALQMALVAATIGDVGRRPTPTLALGEAAPLRRELPSLVAATERRLMVDVVLNGTGTAAQIPGVVVAGKTGTAELTTTVCQPTDPTCKPNDPRNTDAWFAAFAPARAPRVVVGVMLAHDGAGGTTAAPVAQVMLQAALAATAHWRR